MDAHLDTPELEELTESVRIGRSVAFIGSGLSIGEYSSWGDLITKLCEICGVDLDDINGDVDYLELAEQAKNTSPDEYHRVLSEEFGKEDVHLPPGYIYLLESPFNAYITMALQQNLWVDMGSGNAPKVWYSAISAA